MKLFKRGYSSLKDAQPILSTLIPSAIGYKQPSINEVSIKALMATNLHLGHNKATWNPRMLPYIYGHRNGIHIINLDHTITALRRACGLIFETAAEGGNIVFVGTKPSLHKLTVNAAQQNNAFFIIHWIGGLITNKERILRRSVGYDPDKVSQSLLPQSTLDNLEEDGELEDVKNLLKKQPFVHKPDLIVLLDYANNKWAAHEANLANIPVVAICDTDCDPTGVSYPIPANDDSVAGVGLIAGVLGKACREGHERWMQELEKQNELKQRK
ncbi:37S ribosomal protein, mitochondrial [Boothiomyces sp. JEL0838]|nr:37S ribosomal protein, mitochondrial [Boothiomyces sp. JEL0838]